ncbi:MAG: glycosyltransferase family 2 protein [Agathobacter sp.]|nr:glycosyltransferase family 2 protein [Agathobacter sp.]
MKKHEGVKVSIIIPIYNVSEWLDTCLESVINQTYTNLEILLINDGSTDDSAQICEKWVEKDARCRLISKENEGPSIARNLGIAEATGEYLSFIDADDWVDVTFIEKMLSAAIDENAEMVEVDVFRVNQKNGSMTYRVCSGVMGKPYTREEHMLYGYTAMWKCLFKKSLFVENDIVFPNCHSEARAIYPLLLAKANKVINVGEALYFYRKFRVGSLSDKPRTNGGDEKAVGVNAFEFLIRGFERCNIYEQYETLVHQIVNHKLSDLLAAFFHRRTEEEFCQLVSKYETYIAQKFPEKKAVKYMTLGGYNLNRIAFSMNLLHNPYGRFNFSSIIGIMNPVSNISACTHKNAYREIMVNREIENDFWRVYKKESPQYMVIDFIEERFDVLDCGDGFLTKSDAFEGATLEIAATETISRESEECQKLWEESCIRFINKLKEENPKVQVILVKNYLSEKVGDVEKQEYYPELEEIRNKNRILKGYYKFFVEHCSFVTAIEASECNYYFTDAKYEYGAIPSHLNELVNREIAHKMEKEIGL